MAPHISVQIASGTVPAMVCLASPLTLRTLTRFSSLEYRYIFSEISSRNTMGISSSAPEIARLLPLQLLSLSRKAFTSDLLTICSLRSMGSASKALTFMGRLLMLMFMVGIVLSLLSLISGIWKPLSCGGSVSAAASSSSRPAISSSRAVLASSCSFFSVSKASTCSVTVVCSSSVVASPMAVSSSASRVAKSASLEISWFNSLLFMSIFFLSMICFNAMVILLSGVFSYLHAISLFSSPGLPQISHGPLQSSLWRGQKCWWPNMPGTCRAILHRVDPPP